MNNKQKYKVLVWDDSHGSFEVVRIYKEADFCFAEKDLALLNKHGSDLKKWLLVEVEMFGS